MTVTLNLDAQIEQELAAQARQRGLSIDAFLQEIVINHATVASPVGNGVTPELPRLHLGVTGPLRRTDIYDDAC